MTLPCEEHFPTARLVVLLEALLLPTREHLTRMWLLRTLIYLGKVVQDSLCSLGTGILFAHDGHSQKYQVVEGSLEFFEFVG
jgi:hypothetical protein